MWRHTETEDGGLSHGDPFQAPADGHAIGRPDVPGGQPLLARESDGRAFRLIGVGAYDLAADGRAPQAGLVDAGPDDGNLDDVLDALRDRFGDDAVVRGRGLGVRLARQGPSKVE